MNTEILTENAIEQKAEQETNLHILGVSHAAFDINPVHPESQEYWQGYSEEKRRYWMKKKNLCYLHGKQKQGYLYATSHQITKRYGKLEIIGRDRDYKGWEIEIEGLKIELVTFDWEEAQKETKWMIFSDHIGSLELLAHEFGQENICDLHVEDIFAN